MGVGCEGGDRLYFSGRIVYEDGTPILHTVGDLDINDIRLAVKGRGTCSGTYRTMTGFGEYWEAMSISQAGNFQEETVFDFDNWDFGSNRGCADGDGLTGAIANMREVHQF